MAFRTEERDRISAESLRCGMDKIHIGMIKLIG